MAGAPATTIAIAGSQYRMKTRHRLDRMSRDSQVVASGFTLHAATSVRSSLFYNLECGPASRDVWSDDAIRKLNVGETSRARSRLGGSMVWSQPRIPRSPFGAKLPYSGLERSRPCGGRFA